MVGFPFDDENEYMQMNPLRKGRVKRREDGQRSSYKNFALNMATVAACPIQIDDGRVPLGYRA
jgi:hypothetical protein